MFCEEFANARGHFSPINSGEAHMLMLMLPCQSKLIISLGHSPGAQPSGNRAAFAVAPQCSPACAPCSLPSLVRPAVAFSPDGTSFVTGAEEGNVRLHHFDADYFTTNWDRV